MQINISARHGSINSTTQTSIQEKVERIRKFYDRVTAINVTVDLRADNKPAVELVVKAELHDDFVSHDSADSILTAVDSAVHKMEMQLRKHKEKLTDRHAAGHKHVEDLSNPNRDSEGE